MCGIYCEARRETPFWPTRKTIQLLKQRGPDEFRITEFGLPKPPNAPDTARICLTFAAAVLSLRGDHVSQQPLLLETAGCLCWNGEAWSVADEEITGQSDTEFLAERLEAADTRGQTPEILVGKIIDVLRSIRGPFAFIYYNVEYSLIFFGRDRLGRRSLLRAFMDDGSLVLSSVADLSISKHWFEVEADAIYVAQMPVRLGRSDLPFPLRRYDWDVDFTETGVRVELELWGEYNRTVPQLDKDAEGKVIQHATNKRMTTQACLPLLRLLDKSVSLRVPFEFLKNYHSIAVLFSGGLDCTIIARLLHRHLQDKIEIDLLNVAFENPRIHKNLAEGESPYEVCPDRITARQTLSELRNVCPGRVFNLICINISFAESTEYREEIRELIYPHDTEMDMSIGMALFFAARGPTVSRILFSGLGADELFGGYQRHALAYKRGGYEGLLDELKLDIDRLGKRNLGRDDRVISRWGKEARYPFLDEIVVAWAREAGIWQKVGFGFERTDGIEGDDEGINVNLDDKLVLRCVAKRLGMHGVAEETKRAIQFGTRSAKMGSGKTKGTERAA